MLFFKLDLNLEYRIISLIAEPQISPELDMKSKLIKQYLLLLSVLLFVPAQATLADTGPKPTMDFQFKLELNGEQVTISSGTLYECKQSDCSDAAPLQQLGPQGFRCDTKSCSAT